MAAEFEKHPFLLPVDEVAHVLHTDIEKGLASSEVTQLQQKYPPNVLDVGEGIAWYTIFFRQLCNAMILVRFSQCPAKEVILTISRCCSSPWPSALALATMLKAAS